MNCTKAIFIGLLLTGVLSSCAPKAYMVVSANRVLVYKTVGCIEAIATALPPDTPFIVARNRWGGYSYSSLGHLSVDNGFYFVKPYKKRKHDALMLEARFLIASHSIAPIPLDIYYMQYRKCGVLNSP